MLRPPPTGARPRSARRDMRLSSIEGASYCVMVGVGQEYFVAFALALGMGEVGSGLVATLPVFVGATLQLAAPWAIRRLGSLRRYMVVASALQAACFVPLLVAALVGAMPTAALYLTVAAYSAINLAQGPAWSTWITTLMPSRVRASYFGSRARMLQVGVLAGLVVGGLLLSRDEDLQNDPLAFAPLFAIALVMRVAGSVMLGNHSEPVAMPSGVRTVRLREVLGRARHGADVKLLTFLLVSNTALQMALPFFTPFVLEHRGLTYLELTTLTGAVIVGKMVAAATAGRIARRFGAKRLLWLGAVGTIPMAPAWLLADSFAALLMVQFVAGTFLVCFDIGAMLSQFDTIPERERASLLATFTAVNALAGFIGSAIGGALLAGVDLGASGYAAAFIAAAVMRVVTLPLLTRVPRMPRTGDPPPTETLRIEPGAGATELPAPVDEPDDEPDNEPTDDLKSR